MKKIIITLNGENNEFDTESGQLSVSKFAEIRNLKGFFAIELINKEDYDSTFIKEGDSVEVVGFAGGG